MNAHLHPFTDPRVAEARPPRQIVSGDGIRVTDEAGATFVDAVSGLWCASLGFAPERLRRAASEQMGRLGFYHSFMGRTCEVTTRLSERLVARLPGDLDHVIFGTSGSEAVELAVKLARYAQTARHGPERVRVIARDGAYHGSGVMSAALTSMAYCHDGFHLPRAEVLRTGRAHWLADAEPGEDAVAFSRRRGRELDALIRAEDPGTIAAFIGEPAMGSGGVFLPPEGYWAEVQEVLARHGILLIADEIITGFGRTGEWFGCETWGIAPDLMTMAKQLTGAVFPLSAVAMTGAVREAIADRAHGLGTLGHGVTYGGHPVGAAVALEALAAYEEMDLPAHVGRLGARLGAAVEPLRGMAAVRDVRRAGLLAGVEFHDDATCRAVGDAAEAGGTLFRVIGPVLGIAPPYVATPAEVDAIGAALVAAARRTA